MNFSSQIFKQPEFSCCFTPGHGLHWTRNSSQFGAPRMSLPSQPIWDIDIAGAIGTFTYQFTFTSQTRCISLIGNNGAGKSTLLKLVAGLHTPQRGHIKVQDKTLFCTENHINLSPQSRASGYIPQGPSLFPHLTVQENWLSSYKLKEKPKTR